jgi:pimeloyl-ACP methyl ester carboxylesterase
VTAISAGVSDRSVEVAGNEVRLLEDGVGDPLMVFHHSTGNLGWTDFYSDLARSFHVIVPDLPGYGRSGLPVWARSARDLAIVMSGAIRRLDLGPLHLVGLGFGGFVAAELATINPDQLATLTLVGAAGVQPRAGEIVDQVMIGFEEYARLGFSNPETFDSLFSGEVLAAATELWDYSRVMTCRVAWKPWMFSQALPHLLCEIETPTLLAWGGDDRVIPVDCGHRYLEGLADARLEIIEGGGHILDLERPHELAELVMVHADAHRRKR